MKTTTVAYSVSSQIWLATFAITGEQIYFVCGVFLGLIAVFIELKK